MTNDGSISAIVKGPLFTIIMLAIATPMIISIVNGGDNSSFDRSYVCPKNRSVQTSISGAPFPIAK